MGKKIFTLTGASGSGKDSLLDSVLYLCGKKTLEELSPFVRSKMKDYSPFDGSTSIKELVSHTSREPRQGEINDVDYHFTTAEDIISMEKIEFTQYAGNYYCLSSSEVEKMDTDVGMIIVDASGAQALKKYALKHQNVTVISVFVKAPESACRQRMEERGDKPENIERRIKNALENDEYEGDKKTNIGDIIIENNDLAAAANVLFTLITGKHTEKI